MSDTRPLKPGDRVHLFGLNKEELNGQNGTVLGIVTKTGRHVVLLDTGDPAPIRVKGDNLRVDEAADANFDRLTEYAVTSGAMKNRQIDKLTDEIACSNCTEAELAAIVLYELECHVLPDQVNIIKNIPKQPSALSPLQDGEYVICNVITRPELNGQVCSVDGCGFARGEDLAETRLSHSTSSAYTSEEEAGVG